MSLPSALTAAQVSAVEDWLPGLKQAEFGTKVNAILAAIAGDPGRKAVNVLRLAGNVASTETVTIGSDVYEINIVNTDTTAVTAGGEANNTTNPIQLTCAAHGRSVGDLVRIENEILKVLGVPTVNTMLLSRGHSGTTAAAHANGVAIYVAATQATAGRLEVGMVATLTPAVASVALAAVINADGTAAVTATKISDNEVLLASDSVGAVVLACTETLATANNAWANATMYGGRAAGQRHFVMQSRVPTATEVALDDMHFCFDFAPTVIAALVRVTATPGVLKAWDGGVTVTGNRVTLDNGGSTDWATTDTVVLIVTD
jgi:hypothetical protein